MVDIFKANTGITNPSKFDAKSLAKITNPAILGEPNVGAGAGRGGQGGSNGQSPVYAGGAGAGRGSINNFGPVRDLGRIGPGAEPASPPAATNVSVTSMDRKFDPRNPDLRVKIRVPADYLTELTNGSWAKELSVNGGIIFPYTPQIDFEHKAEYTSQTPTHSNYAINFYKNSSVTDISIQGKFTVENDQDAMIYLATVHLLRALTKMRFGGPQQGAAGAGQGGGSTADKDSGAPPPVCRLDAYGDFMLKNVPVAIASFKNTLPDNVDFYTLDKSGINSGKNPYGMASVPILSTIAIVCKPMYSRAEMQGMSVSRYLNTALSRQAGYL
jgi:hypothetical protein